MDDGNTRAVACSCASSVDFSRSNGFEFEDKWALRFASVNGRACSNDDVNGRVGVVGKSDPTALHQDGGNDRPGFGAVASANSHWRSLAQAQIPPQQSTSISPDGSAMTSTSGNGQVHSLGFLSMRICFQLKGNSRVLALGATNLRHIQ